MPPVKNKPRSLSVDFSGVEDKRQATRVPPGDYITKIKDYELRHKKDDESRTYLNWELEITQPAQFKGKTLYHITSLVPESLWNLRNFLQDLGVTVPKKAVDIPMDKLVGREIGVTVEDDEYDNKIRSKVQATFNKNDLGEVEASDEDSNGVATAATSDDDEDTEELDLDDL